MYQSGTVNDPAVKSVKSQLTDVSTGYGQTETILLVCNGATMTIKPGSMGKPVPGIPVEIIDDFGNPVSPGQEGDIAVLAVDVNRRSSPFLFRGYLSNNGTMSRKTRPWIGTNGTAIGEWYITGDRAYKDEDGYIWFVGRSDDVINSSGYRIGMSMGDLENILAADVLPGPFEVESTLKLHPAVVESAVVGVSDPQRVEIVKAFVVLDPAWKVDDYNALTKELQDYCKRETAPYKYPRSIEYVPVDWLPKTTSGKIKRSELRQLERSRARSARI